MHDPIYPLHCFKSLNCLFFIFNDDDNNNNNNNNNNKNNNYSNVIRKIKLELALSVNLGPIIVDIITKNKNKIDVPVGIELAMSAFHTIF